MLHIVKRLLHIIPASKASLVGMVFLFIFSSAIEVVGIGAIAPFISLATNPQMIYEYSWLERLFRLSNVAEESRFIALLGLLTILLFCLKVLVSWMTQVFICIFSCRQQKLLINKLLERYLSAPYTYHLKKSSSYIIDNILEVTNKFHFIIQPLFVSIANICIVISLFFLLWYTSGSVMLILLVILLPVVFLINSFRHKLRSWGQRNRQSKAQLIKTIGHSLGGIKETKVIGCESYFQAEVGQQTRELESCTVNSFGIGILPRFLIETVMLVFTVSVICYYLLLGRDVNQLQSVLGIYALASIRLLPAFTQAIGGINILRNNSFTIDQIYFDLEELGKKQPRLSQVEQGAINSKAVEKLDFQKSVRLEKVSYAYPNQEAKAIEQLSLTINKGESIAFIGKSGAGKTTLVDIILGLLIPQDGDIKLDGTSIYRNPDMRAWQNLVGYIPQSIFLADDTIRKNIAFGVCEEDIDLQRLYKAIDAAQLTDVVNNLPQGIETKVGERGVLLSGGQRQRVGIARALYHEREILILDEATAALDNETERLVTDAIDALSGEKTLITIAHRLTTVEKCDRVYCLEKGRIVKSGKYQDVVR